MIKDKAMVEACIAADAATKIIRVNGCGFWQPEEIEVMLDRLAKLVTEAHGEGRRARVLVDLGEAGPQMAVTVARIAERSHFIYATGDRLAIVLLSPILKLQISRVNRAAEYRIFTDVTTAEAWLRSADQAASC